MHLRLGYESIESLPQGSNEVRRYFDPHLKCERVGKRIDLSMVDSATLPEASTLQSISHPNIVPIVTAADVSGYDPTMKVIEIVTPFYPRGSITDALLRGEKFAGYQAVTTVRSALLGLRELHISHGICHRDIKSGNILLTDAPIHALVADIGVAGKLNEAGTVPTVGNATLYSPPEFRSGVLTPSSDLYSMGLILRELLGGAFPYAAYSRHDVYESLDQGENPLSAKDRELPIWAPKSVRAVYAKATHTIPSRRYQTAKDMSAALSKVRIADWRQVSENVWEASHPQASSKRVRVTAETHADGYSMSIKKGSGEKWRRIPNIPDETVPAIDSSAARAVFTTANAFAVS